MEAVWLWKRNTGKSVKWFSWSSVTTTWDESQGDFVFHFWVGRVIRSFTFFYFSCLFNNHGKMNLKTMCVLLRQQEGWDLSLLETILLVPSEASGLQRKRGPINYVSIWWTEIAVAHSWKAWWTGFQFKSSSCEWRKLFSRGMHCIPFECTVLCFKTVQVHFSLQTEDSLLLLLLTGRRRAKVEEERRDRWIFCKPFCKALLKSALWALKEVYFVRNSAWTKLMSQYLWDWDFFGLNWWLM